MPAFDPATSAPARRLLDPRRGLAAILVVGALLLVPAVLSPFILDDFMHRAMVDGRFGAPRGPIDLYDFVNDRDRPMMLERGLLPWWSHPRLTIRFFRPLASALRFYEIKLLDGQTVVPHLHSLLWWAAAVLAAGALLRRWLPPRPALIATAIFALGPWHVLPVAWLANREVLISLAFGVAALDAHARFREHRRTRDLALAVAGFSAAFASGEYALCFGGYVLAIEWCRPREPLLRRAASLLPFAAPALAYLALREALGYGSHGSAFYTDPLRDPGSFVAAAPARLVTLLAEGWGSLGSDAWGTDAPRWSQELLVLAGGALVWGPLARALRGLPGPSGAAARWLVLGSLLSLLPVLAVAPSPRLLGVSALGMAAAIAVLIEHAWFPTVAPARWGAPERTALCATLLGFLHLVHGPLITCISGVALRRASLASVQSVESLRARLPDVAAAEIAVARGGPVMFFGPLALDPGGSLPGRWWILAHTSHVLAVHTAPNVLTLGAPPDVGLFPHGSGNLFRSPELPLRAGDTVELAGMRVRILAAGDHGPYRARYTFERPLDRPPMVWLNEGWDGALRDFTPPATGFGEPLDP